MRPYSLLPLVGLVSAFVIPDQQTLQSFSLQKQEDRPHCLFDSLPLQSAFQESFHDLEAGISRSFHNAEHKLKDAINHVSVIAVKYRDNFQEAFASDAWFSTADYDLDLVDRPPPHHGKPPHRRPPHKRPGHHKTNLTVYQLISKSNYTTKLAAAIDEFPDLVKLLNGTTANFTVFAPTDRAFAKIPENAPKPSKEFLEKLLSYHVSPEFYPAGRVLVSRTIPTALEAEAIGKVPQRLSTQISLRGLTVNFYARVIAVNIFGSNGVIHGIDSLLLPPPKAVDILSLFPEEFSTLELGLIKTGLYPSFNDTSTHHGGTFFAPSNFAFARLGPKANAFLFSKFGLKYLRALLVYHAADNITLYSDAMYKSDAKDAGHKASIPKGFYHVDLPSGLDGKPLSVDVARYGRLITIKINGFTRVSVPDGIAADGVVHVVPNVLIPPKTPGAVEMLDDEIEVDDLVERLEPYVDHAVKYEEDHEEGRQMEL